MIFKVFETGQIESATAVTTAGWRISDLARQSRNGRLQLLPSCLLVGETGRVTLEQGDH